MCIRDSGIGVSNTPLIDLLLKNDLPLTVCDMRTEEALGDAAAALRARGAQLRLGPGYLDDLDGFDYILSLIHILRGTPFVYQGEELGMVNVPWTDVSQLRDIESLTFAENCRRTGAGEEFMWDAIHRKARDNARTPMPWNGSKNGGLSLIHIWHRGRRVRRA